MKFQVIGERYLELPICDNHDFNVSTHRLSPRPPRLRVSLLSESAGEPGIEPVIDRFPAVTLESAGCDQSRGKGTTAVSAVRAFSPVVSFSNRRDARFPSQPRRLTSSNAGDTTGPARPNKTRIPAGMPAAPATVLAHLRRAIHISSLNRGYRSCLAQPPATGCHPSGMDTVGPMFSNED